MRNNRNFPTTQTFVGALLFICALIFYYFSVLTIDYRDTRLLYLGHSDPAHYFAHAKALLKHELPTTQIGCETAASGAGWISGAHASVAEDSAGSRFHPCAV